MKKRVKILLFGIASIILLGTIFGIIDYNRVINNQKPLFMVSLRNRQDPLNYIGLGYRMERFTGVSHKQPLSNDSWVKLGTWIYVKKIEIKSGN